MRLQLLLAAVVAEAAAAARLRRADVGQAPPAAVPVASPAASPAAAPAAGPASATAGLPSASETPRVLFGHKATIVDAAAMGEEHTELPMGSHFSTCSCDCCETKYREPAEILNPLVYLKCALNFRDEASASGATMSAPNAKRTHFPEAESIFGSGGQAGHGLSCPSMCAPDSDSDVTPASKEAMEYNRFCFYSCTPFDVIPGSPCKLSSKPVLDVTEHIADSNSKDASPLPAVEIISAAPTKTANTSFTPTRLPCIMRDPCIYDMMNDQENAAKGNLDNSRAEAVQSQPSTSTDS